MLVYIRNTIYHRELNNDKNQKLSVWKIVLKNSFEIHLGKNTNRTDRKKKLKTRSVLIFPINNLAFLFYCVVYFLKLKKKIRVKLKKKKGE